MDFVNDLYIRYLFDSIKLYEFYEKFQYTKGIFL